jgi:hypothetical protein
MSGAVSGSQFMPRPVAAEAEETGPVTGKMYQQWKGESSLAPHAAGAFTSFDRQTAFRAQGSGPVAHSPKTVGSWLFKND